MRDTRLSEYDRKRQIKDEWKVLGLRNWKAGTDMSRSGEGFSIRMTGEGLDIRSSVRCDNCKMPPGHSSGDIKWVEQRRSTFIPEHLETYLTSCFLSLGDPLLFTEHWEQSCREDSWARYQKHKMLLSPGHTLASGVIPWTEDPGKATVHGVTKSQTPLSMRAQREHLVEQVHVDLSTPRGSRRLFACLSGQYVEGGTARVGKSHAQRQCKLMDSLQNNFLLTFESVKVIERD